ncbi:MAG: permease [Candidatus Omnitrophica bacterium]|nr:permease [Candidatus Omnitrophota bacterium]
MDPLKMATDPICGMTGVIERHGQWFCSERCIVEFERRAASRTPRPEAAVSCHATGTRWYLDPWVWVPLSGLLLSMAGQWWAEAAPVSAIYAGYLKKVLVPFLLGLLLGGFIDHCVPKEYIVKLLSGPSKRVIARSTILGFLASSCSHGCLALTIELYRKGASVPAVVSFLLASPWASMSLTFILLSLFGLKGVVIVLGALAIAFVTGLAFQRLALRGLIESNPETLPIEEGFSIWRDVAARARRYPWSIRQLRDDARGILAGMLPLGRMVLGWVQLGLILSAVLGAWIPHATFERLLGPSVGGLLLTLLAAAVIEVCSEGTAPLAYEIYRHTGALGNSFAFLMGGVVTDYTELGAIWTTIGRKTVCWILLLTLPMVLVVGWLLN